MSLPPSGPAAQHARDGAIGRDAIQSDGPLTGTTGGRLAVVGGRLVWDG